MFKRIGVLLVIFLLFFGNMTFAAANQLPKVNVHKEKAHTTQNLKPNVDPEKDVRVIVEMKGEAPIEKATKKGLMFKSLAKTEQKSLENAVKAKQKKVKDSMQDKKVKAKYLQEFNTVVNGFSAEIKQKDIEVVKQLPDVKAVHIVNEYKRPEIKPQMKYSKELVQAQQAWRDYGYKGEGMVVGIIDTGIDPSHRDMVLSDDTKPNLTKQKVDDIVRTGLPGKFYTEKVPYGYNYMDENDEIRDIYKGASMHGMHVAGTVGANGDEDNGGIKGIAPEAQLLALKVFGNDPEMASTYGDIYIKAIDDAIKLGADVLNMSLGSTAGFVDAESPEQQAVTRAVNNGIVMSISAGNSALFADGYYYPLASNPDYGVSGSPGLATDSIQVASFENSNITVDALNYQIGDEKGSAPFLSAGETSPDDYVKTKFDLVDAGIGAPEDFAGKDVKGKYALIKRGELAFTDKALNAQKAGAEGVIIYNNTDGIVNMATDSAIVIPQLFMLKSDGDKLAAALKDGKSVSIDFTGEKANIQNPDAGKMSAFSSWGLTPNLDFKPEITAPGGQILSTLNNNEYGLMSGTSMAAPHVSGGSALVLERVQDEFKLENAARVNRAKNLMMNTAKIVDFDGSPVSPRRQGAGLMQLHAALSTPVMVTESDSKEAKVALKEIKGNKATFELTAENFTDKAVSYDVKVNAQTDQPVNNGGEMLVLPKDFGALDLTDDVKVNINGKKSTKVNVPANGKTKLTVSIDVSKADTSLRGVFENGYWLEGFVTLTDPTDTNPQLHVPYVGFKGQWDKAPIFDTPMWSTDTYYGMTGVATSLGDGDFGFLGEDLNGDAFDPGKIAFSPNEDGTQDDALLIVSMLRNAKELKYQVLDADKNVVRTIRTEDNVRKNYYDGGQGPMYLLNPDAAWDGKINGKLAADGVYYLQAEAVIDYPGAKAQTLAIPVRLDTKAPELKASFDKEKQLVSVTAKDEKNGSGLAYWDVLVDGKSVLDTPYTNGETEHQLVKKLKEDQKLTVVAVDYAGNKTEKDVTSAKDTTAPDLHWKTPEFLGVVSDKEVVYSGYVTDKSGVKEVTIDGKKAKLDYDEENDRYNFTYTEKVKDGYHLKKIKAIDNAGNETEIGRRFFVDTKKATLKVDAKKKVKTDTAKVTVKVKDNFDDIRLYVNDSEVFKHELSEPYGMHEFNQTFKDLELQLQDGKNEFEFKVVDLGGHETIQKVVIEKKPGKDNGHGNGNGNSGGWLGDIVASIIHQINDIIGSIWGWLFLKQPTLPVAKLKQQGVFFCFRMVFGANRSFMPAI
ncbi:S8 family serine peptidase [Virgibacillus sp. 179-BFC.A HS]|uniref:S8 family serine peptidase n=1 Tax=Tigheibacillus jepli TaxID=3035914 RepID=A0ABU5CE70_9BACI|nr:S8 family serine peptidase [Virgibacillus sp. 179-BFC.A HS]MDY0404604.1 S8 family serine peptidase [Virgibacillus sp. 179-BFC.A HS]